MAEHPIDNREVAGSTPALGTIAESPSGLRRRSHTPVFAGSNPASATSFDFVAGQPGVSLYRGTASQARLTRSSSLRPRQKQFEGMVQWPSISVSKTDDQGSNPCSFAKQKVPAEHNRAEAGSVSSAELPAGYSRPCGGIGRHNGLKIRRPKGCASSSLAAATKAEGPLAQQARAPGS